MNGELPAAGREKGLVHRAGADRFAAFVACENVGSGRVLDQRSDIRSPRAVCEDVQYFAGRSLPLGHWNDG